MRFPVRRRVLAALAGLVLLPVLALAAPTSRDRRPDPGALPALPSFVQRVEPAIVGLRVRVDEAAPSAARLGTRRSGSGVIFDPRGYVLTVSYILLDAAAIEARTRDGRVVPGRLVGIDFDSGLGVVGLDGGTAWPAAPLGRSADVAVGALAGTVGVDDDNDLVHVTGTVHAIRRFAGPWEYMLDRAFLLAPASDPWSGNAVVDDAGTVVAIASLRLGEPPHVTLAIPIEQFLPVKDELIASGRITSRAARPWLGLYTVSAPGGLVVEGVSPLGPARDAGFRRGDRVMTVNGMSVGSQEEFYEQLWRARAGDVIQVAVRRGDGVHVISVRSVDRHRVFRTTAP